MPPRLPSAFQASLAGATLAPVRTGMSGAAVYRVTAVGQPERYLKIARGRGADALRQEIARTSWLGARGVRVPAVLQTGDSGRTVALLMGAVTGTSADAGGLPAGRIAEAAGRALAALHALPAADCPFDETLAVRLARARRAVAAGEIDAGEFDSRNRRLSPAALLRRLMAEPPEEDLVVAHGDATLANILVADDLSVGFVDCGHAGRADRYLDLGVAAADIGTHLGGRFLRPFIRAYGLARLDRRKALFYSDLYELL